MGRVEHLRVSASGRRLANVMEFRFTQASIGNTTSFNFAVVSVSIDETGGQFTYQALGRRAGRQVLHLRRPHDAVREREGRRRRRQDRLPGSRVLVDDRRRRVGRPVTLKAGKAKVTPAKPKAGGRVGRVGSGDARVDGRCADRRRRRRLRRADRRWQGAPRCRQGRGGRAVCTFKVPLGTEGQDDSRHRERDVRDGAAPRPRSRSRSPEHVNPAVSRRGGRGPVPPLVRAGACARCGVARTCHWRCA